MRKLFLLTLTVLLGSSTAFTQTKTDKAHVTWGADMEMKADGTFMDVIDDVGNSVYMLIGRHNRPFIQRLDGLKVAYQKPLDLQIDKEDLKLERVLLTKNEVIVFSSRFDKKEKLFQLYVSTYDQDGFNPQKRFVKIARIDAEKAKNKGDFSIYSSPDQSKVMVLIEQPYEKGAREKFAVQIYDASMEQLWSQDVQLPYNDADFGTESYRVDNDGSVVMLGVKYAEKQESKQMKREGKPSYQYHLLTFTKDSPDPQDHAIEVADKFLQDLTLSMGGTGDIICAGFYGNKGTFNVRGTFFLRLDRDSKQVVHESYKEFSDDFITSYMTEKEAKKATKKASKKKEELELFSFSIHDLIRRDDGGAVLVAEQYRSYVVCTTDSKGNTHCSTHYIYNDVIVVNIDPEGNIEWASKVPKRQHSVNDAGRYSGCAVDVKSDKIYLIFNDSGENLFLKPGDKIKQFEIKGKDALVVLASIDGSGAVSREALFSPEGRDVILRPQDCVELGSEDMFIYANRKKQYRFGLITFQ